MYKSNIASLLEKAGATQSTTNSRNTHLEEYKKPLTGKSPIKQTSFTATGNVRTATSKIGTLTESLPINSVTNVQTALPPMSASRSSKPMGFNAYRTYSGGEMGMYSSTTLNSQQTNEKISNARIQSPLKSTTNKDQQHKLMQTQTSVTANNLNTNGNSPQKKKQVPFPLGTNSQKYNTNTQYKSLSTRASNMNADDFASKGMDLQNLMTMTPQAAQDPSKVFLPNFEPTKCSLKPNGVIKAYAANTNQGIVRNYNEDRVSIILNMVKPPEKKHMESWPKCSFFGVYDGHGGSACAEYLRDHLHHFVIKDQMFPSNTKEAIKNGFYLAEKTFTEKSEGEHSVIEKSGSCAISVLIIGEMCYAANVGDSRAIMSAEGGSKIYVLSRDHRPTDDQEQHRIVSNGGKIYQTQTAVKVPMFMMGTMGAQQQNNGSQYIIGPHRVLPGRLSVSRTFGDIEAKIVRFGGNPNVVVATPEIKGFKITQEHDFIILACDGIYDKMSNRDVINCVWETARKSKAATIHQMCGECVEMVLKTSISKRTLDNITVVMIVFDNFKNLFFPENQGDRALTEPDCLPRDTPLNHGNRRVEDESKGVLSARYSQPLRNMNEIERISETIRKSKTTVESPSIKAIHKQQSENVTSQKYEDPPISRYKTLSGYTMSSARQPTSIPSDSELYKPIPSGSTDRRLNNYPTKLFTDPSQGNKELEEKHKEDSKSERKRTHVTDEGRAMIPRDPGSPYKKKLKKLLSGSTNK